MQMERNVAEILSSLIVLILTVLTIAVFIVYGYGISFYVLIVIALAFAIFNLWFIANSDKHAAKMVRTRRRAKV